MKYFLNFPYSNYDYYELILKIPHKFPPIPDFV